MPQPPTDLNSFDSLVEVIRTLRSDQGCPWDRKQTHQTLTRYAVEEVGELIEAIENGLSDDIRDELGDVLLQVMLHAQIAKENKTFDIKDVIESLNKKMIRRHPHVFSDKKLDTPEQVQQSWQQIKQQEKRDKNEIINESDLGSIKILDALMAAEEIGTRTRDHFDWPDAKAVFTKVEEELNECIEAIDEGKQEEIENEVGDLLFSIAQWARHLKVSPEKALRKTNRRFTRRYHKMLEFMQQNGKSICDLSAEEKEQFWRQSKQVVG